MINQKLNDIYKETRYFDKRYGIKTEEFYENFVSGALGDDMDFFEWKALKEIRDELKEEKKVLIELMDGSELHVFEYIDFCMHKIDYSYHWQDKEKRLITRWDNAPHHSEIETFPHHVHKGEDTKPSEEPTLLEILKKIGEGI